MFESESLEQTKILEALKCLEKISSKKPFEVSIMVETGDDEAIMIGTVESYIWLIIQLLRHLSDKNNLNYRETKIEDYSVEMAPLSIFNSFAHIVPRSLWVTNSDDDSQKVVEYLQKLSPK